MLIHILNISSLILNSCSKFNARCLPTILEYIERKSQLPEALCFSLATFIKFYQGEKRGMEYWGKRADGTEYQIKDDGEVIDFFYDIWTKKNVKDIPEAVLSNTAFWSGKDLTKISGLTEKVTDYLVKIETGNIRDIVKEIVTK